LEAGVQLYELKPSRYEDGAGGKRRTGGSSGASLHAKTFAVDYSRIFVGSFNFDPRSALLNTEMGLLIESPALAGRLAQAFGAPFPLQAYEVRAQGESGLEWIESTGSGKIRHDTEPETGLLRRLWIQFLSILPIDWLL